MSHFAVMVIGDNAEEQLAPYEEYLGGCENPKWDWYELGGRWTGYLKMKNTHERDGVCGSPGIMTDPPRYGYLDRAEKCDIDVEGMRAEAAEKAKKEWDEFREIVNGREIPKWEEVLERHGINNIDKAKAEYGSNPVARDLRKASWFEWDHIASVDEATYIKQKSDSALCTFALVKDGKWYERGEMGWWGIVSNEKDRDEWAEEFSKLFDELPDTTIISIYDCHI